MIGCVSYFLNGEICSLVLVASFALFIAVGNGGKWAAKMLIFYIVIAYLNALLRYVSIPVLSVIMSVFGVTILKLVPIAMMGIWILHTTQMDDLMVSLQRMRLPQAVTIPLVLCRREEVRRAALLRSGNAGAGPGAKGLFCIPLPWVPGRAVPGCME